MRRDDVIIHFGKSSTGRAVPGSAHRDEGLDAYILVDDIEALAADLKTRGADILEGPVQRPYGRREIVVRDPNGFKIAFGQ